MTPMSAKEAKTIPAVSRPLPPVEILAILGVVDNMVEKSILPLLHTMIIDPILLPFRLFRVQYTDSPMNIVAIINVSPLVNLSIGTWVRNSLSVRRKRPSIVYVRACAQSVSTFVGISCHSAAQ